MIMDSKLYIPLSNPVHTFGYPKSVFQRHAHKLFLNELTKVSADTNRLSNVKRRICVVYSWSIQSNMSNTRNFWRGTEKQFTVVLMPLPVNAFERKYIWSCGFEKKNLDEKIFTQQKSSYKTSVCHVRKKYTYYVVKVKIAVYN